MLTNVSAQGVITGFYSTIIIVRFPGLCHTKTMLQYMYVHHDQGIAQGELESHNSLVMWPGSRIIPIVRLAAHD